MGDHLINYQKHVTTIKPTCVCDKVQKRFKKLKLPVMDGHIAFTAADYKGPHWRTLQQNCQNVLPPSINGDLNIVAKGIKLLQAKLPTKWKSGLNTQTHEEWVQVIKKCYCEVELPKSCGNMIQTLELRRLLDGLVLGPLDKHSGQLWAC